MWRPIDRDEAIQAIRRGDKIKITHHGCLKHRFRWQTLAITHPQMYAKHTEIQLELKRKKEV